MSVPGFPTAKLRAPAAAVQAPPPELLSAHEHESTPPSARLPHAPQRQRTGTIVGVAPPAPQSAPQPPPMASLPPVKPSMAPRHEPPRSFSPAPASAAIRVTTPDGSELLLKQRHLRRLWVWVGPLLLSALGTAFGYVRGYAKGLADAAERLTAIETRARGLGSRVASAEVRLDAVEGAQVAEATSNRAERATALRKLTDFAADLEQVKAATPRIQGLKPPK